MAVGVQGEKEGLKAHICFPLVWLTRPPNRFPNSLTPNRCPLGSHQDNAEGSQEPGRVKPKKGMEVKGANNLDFHTSTTPLGVTLDKTTFH